LEIWNWVAEFLEQFQEFTCIETFWMK